MHRVTDFDELDGRYFVSVSITDHGSPYAEDAGNVDIGFGVQRVSESQERPHLFTDDGCNGIGGVIRTLENGRLELDGPPVGTAKGCQSSPELELGGWWIELLKEGPAVEAEHDRLILEAGTKRVELVEFKSSTDPTQLLGRTWVVRSIVDDGELLRPDSDMEFEFASDAVVVRIPGCTERSGVEVNPKTRILGLWQSEADEASGSCGTMRGGPKGYLNRNMAVSADGDGFRLLDDEGRGLVIVPKAKEGVREPGPTDRVGPLVDPSTLPDPRR